MLTANVDAACQGQNLTYTCVTEGITQRWTIETENPIMESFFNSDNLGLVKTVSRNSYHFSFTLISANYHDFTSTFTTTALESLHNTEIECRSEVQSSIFTTNIRIITGNNICTSYLNKYNVMYFQVPPLHLKISK